MAIAQDNKILATDIQSNYTSFNNFIANFGGSIQQISSASIPAAGNSATDTQINTLYNKINEFRIDEFLKTQLSFWPTGSVARTNLIRASDMDNIKIAVNNFAQVKCRNNATNSYSTNSNTCSNDCNQSCDHSTNSNTCSNNCNQSCSYSTNSNTCSNNCNQSCSYSTNSNACSNTCSRSCSHSAHTQDCSHGTNGNTCSNSTHGRTVNMGNLWCARNPDGKTCNRRSYRCIQQTTNNGHCNLASYHVQRYGCMYSSDRDCSKTCSWTNAPFSIRNAYCDGETCSNSNHGQTCSQTCSITCSNTCSQSCTHNNHSQTCGRTCNPQSCSHNNHGQTCDRTCNPQSCSHDTHGQTCGRTCDPQSCSHDTHGQTCSNTTVIDILCQHNPKTNTSGQ